jgi:N-acetylmuramoyl-L-alanine amidase
VPPPAAGAPVIAIDPGHSRTVSKIDPQTGLNVSDYENEPEMTDVYDVALLVRARLRADGYRVVMTKTSLDQKRDLAARARIANDAHAALGISIHDQAGSNGGIGFRNGNNIVYYQRVGDYRETPGGRKVTFTDASLAAVSKRYGRIFADQRKKVEGTSITLQGDTGYNLGSRGLAPGNIWIVQLLAQVPWIYNESGGNSAGRSGLDDQDKATYAAALVAGVEHCIPPPR